MGTRSLTHVIETWKNDKTGKQKKQCLMTMYRQYDGYPSGMGDDLAQFLKQGKVVNGISMAEKQLVFNGAGCLAAQLVAHFKDGPGGFYLHRPMSKDCGEDYTYEVVVDWDTKEITLRCFEIGYISKSGNYINKRKLLFEGKPQDYDAWLEKHSKQNA
jgi:hypothetical protein